MYIPQEVFRIYDMQISGKCICQSNDYYALQTKLPLGSCHHLAGSGELVTPRHKFSENLLPSPTPAERGCKETMLSDVEGVLMLSSSMLKLYYYK